METLFADGIGNISISNGVVRMDLFVVSGEDIENKKVKVEKTSQIAMPIDGFLRSLEMQEKIREKMVEQGILKPIEKK